MSGGFELQPEMIRRSLLNFFQTYAEYEMNLSAGNAPIYGRCSTFLLCRPALLVSRHRKREGVP